MNMPPVRSLVPDDIASAMALSRLAGWNQTDSDWNHLLHLHPESCLGIECDGRIVATTTLICYGDELAWLGMVLTHPEYRRRGFARRLVEIALRMAERKNIGCVKLDATAEGSPLYQSLGFNREQEIERWSCIRSADGLSTNGNTARLDFALDREAFGADRSALLQRLTETGEVFATDGGFGLTRPGTRAWFLGPCVARSLESARSVIERALMTHHGAWFWDLLPSNRDAVRIATELEFKPERKLVRMVRGGPVSGQESMIYAGGGFEFG